MQRNADTCCSVNQTQAIFIRLQLMTEIYGVDFLGQDFGFNSHVDSIIKKASKRLYLLLQLKRANVPAAEMICFIVLASDR